MGQEIERARALLAALARDGVLVGARADAAYEAWVARAGDDIPFGLFLIRQGHADPRRVRAALRAVAVQGMPHPERFTFERFEDLLMGQLGIEAGMLSPKLLQTVRAVQDKKVEEGKLRRLDELLPRAGFDPVQLRILREHLVERVLICPECLARFPRRDPGRVECDCPRCDGRITAAPVKGSDLELLPEPTKRKLLATSGEGSGVFETLTVAARERRPEPARASRGPSPALVLLGLGTLVAVGGAAWALMRPAPPPPPPERPPRVDTTPRPSDDRPGPGQPRAPTFDEVRSLDRRWAAEGRWAELIDAWRKVEPVAGDDAESVRAAKAERIAQLQARLEHATATRRALEAAQAAPDDQEREMALARAVLDAPLDAPPYDAVVNELRARRAARRAAAREEGRRRVEQARQEAGGEVDPWAERLDQARRGPLSAVEVAGRVVDGVLVERLDQEGFALRMPDGEVRTFAWGDDPGLGLVVMRRAARPNAPDDRLELLRRALLAHDLEAARRALEDLGVAEADLDPAAVLARARISAAPVALAAGRWRLRWSTRAPGHDLVVTGALASDGGALVLSGPGCQLATPPVEVADASDGAVEATLHVEPGARSPFAAVDLRTPRGPRSYVVRWDAQGWRLEVDLGAGANVLKQGTLPAQAQSVRLRVTQTELAVLLDGVERATAPVAARYDAVTVRVGAADGPLLLTELTVEGALSPPWLARCAGELAAAVDDAMLDLAERAAFGGALALPRLSVEDPQGLGVAGPAALERHEAAREAILAGDLDRAASLLDEVEAQAPRLLAALHHRALVAALQGDLAAAVGRLRRALELDEEFAEARALLALVLAKAGRREAAMAAAAVALEQRPDLAHAYAAQARAAWAARPADRPPSAELVSVPLGTARALAPGDPLVRLEARTLRRARELEASLPARASNGTHAVLAAAGASQRAAGLLKTLDALSLRYGRGLRRGGAPTPLRAVLLPDAAPGPLGRDAVAAWEPDLDLLLVREGTPLGWELAHAAARAFVAGTFGAPPPWLEAGLAASLAAPAASQDPPGLREALAGALPWDAEAWRELFDMPRAALARNPMALGKAWSLVAYAQRQAPTWKVIERLLDRAAAGEAAAWPDDAPIDLATLDAQIAGAPRRR